MNRLFGILHILVALFCLALATHLKDPQLLSMRAYEAPALILFALAGLMVTLRSLRIQGWRQLLFLTAWLTVLGLVGYEELEFRDQKQTVLTANADDARRLAMVGEHLVIGYKKADANIRELVRRGFIAGLFVTRRNVEGKSFAQLRDEIADLQNLRRQSGLPPLIIASDQEGGAVSRLSPLLPFQPALTTLLAPGLSDVQIKQQATSYGVEQGSALAALGVNVNFSPVVDLKPTGTGDTMDFHTRIAERAISAAPEVVAQVALAYSRGLISQGVLPTVKHFPGLGSVAGDTHHFSARLGLTLEELNARDWVPFRRILSQTPALLMIGHVTVDAVDAELPASLSRKVITGLVRETWKHDGLLISDDMTMAAVYDRGLCQSAIQSLNAGMDLLLLSYDWEKVYPVLICLQSAQLQSLEASHSRLGRLSWAEMSGLGYEHNSSVL
jgi:beta-N-acetylhexosaminidase